MSKNLLTEIHNTMQRIVSTFSRIKLICCHCETKNRSLKAEYNCTIVGTLTDEKGIRKRPKYVCYHVTITQCFCTKFIGNKFAP